MSSSLTLNWVKCSDGKNWCPLENVDLSGVTTTGVYLIWYNGEKGRYVRLGQGDIKDRLTAHRADKEIVKYNRNGTLYTTWANVSASQLDGVEAYLADKCDPLVGDRFPDVAPIPVNLPK